MSLPISSNKPKGLRRSISIPSNVNKFLKENIWPNISNEENLQPSDSASQVQGQLSITSSQSHSSQQSLRIRALARQLEIKADLQAWQEQNRIEEQEKLLMQRKEKINAEEQLLKRKKERLLLETELKKANAIVSLCEVADNDSKLSQELTNERPKDPVGGPINGCDLNLHPTQLAFDVKQPSLSQTSAKAACSNSKPSCQSIPVQTPTRTIQNDALISMNNRRNEQQASPQASSATDIVEQLIQSTQQQLAALKLPPTTVIKFDGNPIQYYSFIRSFEMTVEAHENDPLQRLHRLIDSTTGNVKRLLEGFRFYEPVQGYQCAKSFLQKKYGDPFSIRTAYINQVKSCPAIQAGRNQVASLEELTTSLRALIHTTESISELNNLDYTDFIMEIVRSKLPIFMKREWANYVEQILSTLQRQLCLRDLLQFLERALNRLCNPYCQDLELNAVPKADTRPQVKRSNFSNVTSCPKLDISRPKPNNVSSKTNVNNTNTRYCVICQNGSHFLNQCVKFRSYVFADRAKLVKEHKLCFVCLARGHKAHECNREKPCRECDGRHTTLLHPDTTPAKSDIVNAAERPTSEKSADSQPQTNKAVSHLCDASDNANYALSSTKGLNLTNNSMRTEIKNVFMPILPVKLFASNSSVFCETYALLDSGSDTTFCSDKVLKELGVSGVKTKLSLSTLHGTNTPIETEVLSNLRISDWHNNFVLTIPTTFSRPHLCVNENLIPKQRDIDGFSYLNEVHLPELKCGVGLILGQNVSTAFIPQSVIQPPNDCKVGPFAILTKLGWVIGGTSDNPSFLQSRLGPHNSHFTQNGNNVCNSCSEIIAASRSEKPELSVEQQRFLKHIEECIKLNCSDHFEVKLPLKNPKLQMSNNKAQALQRLMSLQKKLKRNDKLCEDYFNYMNSLIESGYAERVPTSESNLEEYCYYMPHHGVYSAQKPDKLRVVFDCSAKSNGLSLNDNLLTGPDLTNTLIGVLLRFRQEEVALNADIRAMFHQVHIPYPDNNYFRYLWFENNNINERPVEFRMNVYVFGTVTSPSVANFALKEIARRFKSEFSEETCAAIMSSFYVDDLLKSVATLEAAIELRQEITAALAKAGFHITKWTSNKPELLATIPEEDVAVGCKWRTLEDCCNMPNKTALGVKWDITRDKFGFCIDLPDKPRTRRGMLSMLNSIFDPMGFLTPITLRAKLILQGLCKLGLSWDDEIPAEVAKQWDEFLIDVTSLSAFSIDRCYKPPNFGNVKHISLHHFCDASESGIAAVSYIKLINDSNKAHVSLLLSKSKLAPIKKLTIPRLELSSAVMAIQNDIVLRRELQIDISDSRFYTDSMITLYYINNEHKPLKTFVANRVATIRNNSSPNQWAHVKSEDNIADIASRGASTNAFLANDYWKPGPGFLKQPMNENSKTLDYNEQELLPYAPELKKSVLSCAIDTITPDSLDDNVIISLSIAVSSWTKLIKIIAYVLRFINNLRQRSGSGVGTVAKICKLNVKGVLPLLKPEELSQAENLILQRHQAVEFPRELKALSEGNPLLHSSSIISLNPMLENGLIRVGGRISNSDIDYSGKHPIVLTKTMSISKLIVNYLHVKYGHAGRQFVLTKLRERYWLINANSCVRQCLGNCLVCRRKFKVPGQQLMADLPVDRLDADSPPFTNTGIDFFGPFNVKRARSVLKRYGVIFTCLTVRAVHLEITSDLSADSFILALRRFLARRGPVKLIRSDQGTNLVGAHNELSTAISAWNRAQINDFMLQHDIDWRFNSPCSSHHGAAWERLIRSARRVLMSLTNEQTMDEETLLTLMCEVEWILNSRPLTKVTDDPRDLEVITPNHLLLMKNTTSFPPGLFDCKDVYSRRRWRQVNHLANVFWARWRSEYLTLLQKRQKWHFKTRDFLVGDVVLVLDENLPRNQWALGRIIDTFQGSKGLVRRVKLRTKTSEIIRPITKLCLITSEDIALRD